MTNYLWRKEWLWPYESLWSIIEKFKYINVFTNVEISPLFELYCVTQNIQFEIRHYIYRYTSYNGNKVSNFFNIEVNHFSELRQLKYNEPTQYLNDCLYFCPQCIKYGYHSYFHQIKFLDTCIFHNINLCKAQDEDRNDFPFAILRGRREAYKSSCDTNNSLSKKFTNIPTARELVTYIWDKKYPEYMFSASNYDTIRFIYSTEQQMQKTSSVAYIVAKEAFLGHNIAMSPITTISFSKCNELYMDLVNKMQSWYEKRRLKYSQAKIPEWFFPNSLKKYVDENDPSLVNDWIKLEYQQRAITPEHLRAIATIILLHKLVGIKNSFEAIEFTKERYNPRYQWRHCDISFNSIMLQKIDENEFSIYLSCFIFERIVNNMFFLILNKLRKEKIKEVIFDLDVDFNSLLPNYVILSQNNTYYIYEV